ncbi:2Fe-2S iron-sulfur cluster-binding protein [Nocardia xishanensis]|uniref:2Fe-2S iron-sulfur cluster-binding protein n=1 Tax=Nocardia xishanensis TaxID=238964 RepID=UPI0035A23CE0
MVFIRADGTKTDATAEDGQSLMQVARANLVPGIQAECGGELSCATCHVFVDERWVSLLPPRSEEEEDMLEVAAAEPTECSRLSCQVKFSSDIDGIVVTVPDVQ